MSDQPRIQRPSLSSQFKGTGTDRAAGLGKLLPPAPARNPDKPPAAIKQSEGAPRPQENSAAAPPISLSTSQKKEPAKKRSSASTGGLRNITAYFEPDVFDAVFAARRTGVAAGKRDKSYDELLVEALGTVTIDDLVTHFQPAEIVSGGLLQGRNRRVSNLETVQRQISLSVQQRDALDDIAAEVGAPSRNALINATFRLALLP